MLYGEYRIFAETRLTVKRTSRKVQRKYDYGENTNSIGLVKRGTEAFTCSWSEIEMHRIWSNVTLFTTYLFTEDRERTYIQQYI